MNIKTIKFACLGGCSILRPKDDDLLDLYNSSHHTQPHTIITWYDCSNLSYWFIRKNRCWSHQEHLLPRWWNPLRPVWLIPVVQIRRDINVYHQQILKSFGQIIDVCITCIAVNFSILPNFCFSFVSNLLACNAKSKNKGKTTDNRMKYKITWIRIKWHFYLWSICLYIYLVTQKTLYNMSKSC